MSVFKNNFFLMIAILSPLMAGVSDNFLLYHSNLFQKMNNYQFLFEISANNRQIGALLGVICIPFLWITYKVAIQYLDDVSKKQIQHFEFIVKYLIGFGFLVHIMYFFIPLAFNSPFQISNLNLVLIKFIELIFVVLYNYYMYKWTKLSLNKENIVLYSARYFNPFIYLILIFLITLVNLNVGIGFIVSFFNVSFLVVFLGVYLNKN